MLAHRRIKKAGAISAPALDLHKKKPDKNLSGLCARRVIFPGRRQPSIVTVNELNYCVRDGNRCTLVTIDTHSLFFVKKSEQKKLYLRFARFLFSFLHKGF